MALDLQTSRVMNANENFQTMLDALQIGLVFLEFIEALDIGESRGEETLKLRTVRRKFVVEKSRESDDIILRKRDN